MTPLLAPLLVGIAITGASPLANPVATSPHNMVATVHPLATDAAVRVLQDGGNAVDAAVAAALTLGVVDGHNSGIGGGCFILVRAADGRIVAIDGRETAPARAHRDMFLRDGKADAEASQTGPLAVAVPGALAAYQMAIELLGKKPLAALLQPGAEIAERGFAIDEVYARNIRQSQKAIAQFPATRALLLQADGEPLQAGAMLVQADLAATYRALITHGTDWFYRGEFAERLAAWMRDHHGLVAAEDFAAYRPLRREPLVTKYRGYTVIGFPPPSSGGLHVAQILNLLESFPVREIAERDPSQWTHVVTEAGKLAFADRAYWLGDPAFASVPRGLASPDYARRLAKRIDLERSTRVAGHATPDDASTNLFSKHTTHIAAADDAGNWVAITATVNTSFGSKVVVPGTGVFLNNEMDDFSAQPGAANAFGLVGAEANAVAPGKRPLSSMSPTIVMRDDKPFFTLGAAGGPTIISQVASVLIRRLDLQQSLGEAVAAPRFHHQWSPDELVVESALDAKQVELLQQRGHTIKKRSSIAVLQAIEWSDESRNFVGVHDPRVPGKAAGTP
ncbi:MAG: Gamma-glutamyltranspeptidase precursor [Planctomycetota bacterium]